MKNALAGKQPIPDLILLDMQMPRIDGYGTVEKRRKIGYQKPVIALTASAMQSDKNCCFDAFARAPISGVNQTHQKKATSDVAWRSVFINT